MPPTPEQTAMGEGIDQLVNAEVSGRAVIGAMYQAARRAQSGPLCLAAAARLLETVQRDDVVILATGLPIFPWFAGEQDGPVGAATLARALVLARRAHPVIVTDPGNVEICTAAARGSGLSVRSVADAVRLPTTTAVIPFPLGWPDAEARATELLDALRPAALIAIERPGANEFGEYHSAGGRRLTEHCAKIDALFRAAGERGLLTIGVGDGGNELGCAKIRDTILSVVPHAERYNCPCEGTIVPVVGTDLLVTAAVSNWGAYGIEAALALLLSRREIMHDRDIDARAYALCTNAGANNADSGLLDVGADGVPGPLHGHIVDLLRFMVSNAMDFGRMYREPRYPWL